jgi:hypothetical protein
MNATATRTRRSPPRYGDAGWLHWPDNPEFSYEFTKVLATAQEGASTISECFLAATKIEPDDPESWHDAWLRLAVLTERRASEAFARGGTYLAVSNWLRASNYFRTAEAFLRVDDCRRDDTLNKMRECSRLYLEQSLPDAQIITIPYGDNAIEGYFIKAASDHDPPAPVVIGIGGGDLYKDDLLYTMRRPAIANGLSLLLIDAPGSEPRPQESRLPARLDVEVPIGLWVDYLETRADVDPRAIGIYGSGLGGPHATRAASRDDRFAAAVCDAWLWERHERSFLMNRQEQSGQQPGQQLGRQTNRARDERVDRRIDHALGAIRCPCLLTIGERDFLDIDEAREAYEAARDSGTDIELKIFSMRETASGPGHVDNPTLAHEFVFNWLRQKMDPIAAAAKQRMRRSRVEND